MNTPPDPAFLRALDEALRLQDEGTFDAEAFRERFPAEAEAVLRKLSFMNALVEPGVPPEGASPASPATGRALGDFRLLEELGRGGMGVVYAARQVSLDREVAVKLLPPAYGANAHLRSRFEREAAAAASLSHPAIVKVHAFGEEDHTLYLAMERVDGPSLAHALARLRERSVPGGPRLEDFLECAAITARRAGPGPRGHRGYVETLVQIAVAMADALQTAHDAGLVHRDVKPGNILLDREGRPHLTDFGLVREEGTDPITRSGQILGTPGFMAPETVRGGQPDHRADVFSLGVVLYEALTLKLPFAGDTTEAIVHNVLHHEPAPLDRCDRRLPRDLSNVVIRALEKEPARRYGSAAALRDDLERFLRGDPVLASRVGALGRMIRRARRRPLMAAVVAGLLVALIGVAVLATLHVRDRTARTRRSRELVKEAAGQEAAGHLEAALFAYREALALDPEAGPARRGATTLERRIRNQRLEAMRHAALARLMVAQRDPELAEEAARYVEGLDLEGGNSREVFVLKAIADFAQKRHEAALAHIREASRRGDSVSLHLLRGWIRAQQGRPERARGELERARSMAPDGIEDFVLAAEQAVQDHDEPRAFELLREARSRWPTSPHIPFKLGLLQKDRHHFDQAVDSFTTALQLAPDHGPALTNRGYTYLGRYDARRALEDFEAALKIHPRDAWALHGVIECLHWLGRRKEAAARLAAALADRPRNPILLNARAVFKDLGEDREGAVADFEAAIAAWPTHPYAHAGRVRTLFALGRREEALAATAKGLATPGLPPASRIDLLNARATALWEDRERAEADLRAGLEIRRSPMLVANLALLYIQTGRMDRAASLLSEQMATGYFPSMARARRGWCRWNLLDVEGGVQDTDAAILVLARRKQIGRYPWIYKNRADMAAAAGDLKAAVDFARRAAERNRRHWLTCFRYLIQADDLAAVEAGSTRDSLPDPFRTLVKIWLQARKGDPVSAWKALETLEARVGVVLWASPEPWIAIRWAGRTSLPASVRATGRELLAGRAERTRLARLEIPEAFTRTRGERDWIVGHALLEAARSEQALPYLEAAARSLDWSHLHAEHGVALALEGRGREAVAAWRSAKATWARVSTVALLVKHGVRAGDPDVDRWLREPFRHP